MKRAIVCLVLLMPLAYGGKVYQYKDANGKTVFSDVPPDGKQAEIKDIKTNSIQTSGGGYALNQAMRSNPVVLWTNSCGKPCDEARELLRKRGVPYAVRNPEVSDSEREALKKLIGDVAVPVLQVGTQTRKGLEETGWHAALDQAGYPKIADPTAKNLIPSTPSPTPAPKAPASATPPSTNTPEGAPAGDPRSKNY